MYLKSLELHGFKSFPDKTLIKFSGGTTVIVGPNGSGKSNITDAMRWVLGELSSKNIRGSKMEDVIFAGADNKKPMSFAEVSVTFDDSGAEKTLHSEYDEVTVTRRYYRSGDSEYFINRKKCRLKDISGLFMNTGLGREGYSIIGQGKIAEIISKKSEERRGVFEESAGISKYRYRKNETEKKLAETEANMERVADIEKELGRRIGPLEKDSEKARRYLELYGEKKKVDISLWLYDSDKIRAAIRKTENDVNMSSHELEMAEDSVKVTSSQIERLYEQSHSCKEASRRNYEATTDAVKKMNDANSEVKILLGEKAHAESLIETEQRLLASAENTAESEKSRLESSRAKLGEIGAEYDRVRAEHDGLTLLSAEKKQKIASLNKELDELLDKQKTEEKLLGESRVRLGVLENSISEQGKRSESIRDDIAKYESEIAVLGKTADEARAQINEYRKSTAESERILEEKNRETQKYADEVRTYETNERHLLAQSEALESRISALTRMQEHFDGYNNSIKHIMTEVKNGRLRGIRGPLSYLIKVESRYIPAIETALGAALQNIVTDDENAAKAAIESLKRNNTGRATFYPLSTIRAQERGRDYDGLERSRGFVGWADELAESDAEYRSIIKSLLARVAVYDNLDNASDSAKARGWRIRAVTLDGQQINAGGSFTGGQTKRDSGMLSRGAQIDALRDERALVSEKLSGVRRDIKEARDRIAVITAETRSEEDKKSLIEVLIGSENKNLSDAESRKNALSDLLSGLISDIKRIEENSAGNNDSLGEIKRLISDSEEKIGLIVSEREEMAAERGRLELEEDELDERLGGVRVRLAELKRDSDAAGNEINDAERRIHDAEQELEGHRTELGSLGEKIKELDERAKEKKNEADETEKEINELREKQRTLDETGDEIDTRLTNLRQTEKDLRAKKELVFVAHSKNESKLASLKEEEQKLSAKMFEDYELTYAAAEKFASENDCVRISDGSRQEFQSRQTELRGQIKALGHVNVDSIDEYIDVKKRYEYIKGQLDDLRASREDILKILVGIEDDMKRIFSEAFEKINKYFGEVFRELFGGGHAEVILTDPDNVLESGIEINAAPPGKTIKNLSLLSGGEQAFIAIALLFALIKVNPSPFCIFDEIEAALDEVNVTRVGKYIKKVSKEMQIIMISHRRGTMDNADSLYGVTMQESGISKVFTLSSGENHDDLLR